MKTVYVFSGLGADERVFHKIDFSLYNVHFVQWIAPKKNETIEDYSLRLAAQITTENPILVGLSFGGMMAVEVSKHISTEKIIIISSAKSKNEIPFYFRLAGKLGVTKIIPATALIKVNLFTNWFFSNRTVEDKKMLSAILNDTDPAFLKWAINTIATWQNTHCPYNLYHIHGDADRILPYKFVTCHETIKKGAHLMIVNRSAEVNELLNKLIK